MKTTVQIQAFATENYRYRLVVSVNGAFHSDETATPMTVIKTRNKLAEYWSERAHRVHALPIPRIPTRMNQ